MLPDDMLLIITQNQDKHICLNVLHLYTSIACFTLEQIFKAGSWTRAAIPFGRSCHVTKRNRSHHHQCFCLCLSSFPTHTALRVPKLFGHSVYVTNQSQGLLFSSILCSPMVIEVRVTVVMKG